MPYTQYQTLVKTSGNSSKEFEKTFKKISQKPNSNVRVIGTWTSFGQYDGVCHFEAENQRDAMDFVSESLKGIDGVLSTETLTLIPQASYTPGTK